MKIIPLLLVLAFLAWAGFVLWQGQGQANPFVDTGQFGDSFGVFSAVMAGLAAFYAYKAYEQARAEADQAAAAQKVRDDWAVWLPSLYKSQIAEGEGREHLWHYFRFTYHILRFVKTRFADHEVAYGYARMLRAELSDAEQVLIALNGLYFDGDKDKKLKPLIEEFALLHNIRDTAKTHFALSHPGAYAEGAFEHQPPGEMPLSHPSSDDPPSLSAAPPTGRGGRGGVVRILWSSWDRR